MVGRNDLILLSIGELLASGAVGGVMAPFADASGQPIDHPITRRAIALPLEALRKVPNVVFASGGANKTTPSLPRCGASCRVLMGQAPVGIVASAGTNTGI